MKPLPWWHGILPGLDFETTGKEPAEARAVTASLIFTTPRGAVLDGSLQLVVDPGVPVPEEAAAIHGWTTERIASHPGCLCPEDALGAIAYQLEAVAALGWPLVIYNARYDWTLLFAEMRRHGVEWDPRIEGIRLVDPLVMDRKLDRWRKGGRKLGAVAKAYGVSLEDAHDATADVMASCMVARKIALKYGLVQRMGLDALQDAQRSWHAEWIEGMNEWYAKQGKEDRIPDESWPS